MMSAERGVGQIITKRKGVGVDFVLTRPRGEGVNVSKILQTLFVHAPLEREELYFNGLSFSLSRSFKAGSTLRRVTAPRTYHFSKTSRNT